MIKKKKKKKKQKKQLYEHIANDDTKYIVNTMTDQEGIDRAYKAKDGVYIFGDRMYISGTRNMQDVWDDITKVSMYDKLLHSERYGQAKEALDKNPQVKHLSGHSLGGVVAMQLQKRHPQQIQSARTFGAPVFDPTGVDKFMPSGNFANPLGKLERFKNAGDPVAMFDNSAKTSIKTNLFSSPTLTHAHDNISSQFKTTEIQPTTSINQDGSVSMIG